MRRPILALLGFFVLSTTLFGQQIGRIKPLDLGDNDADLVFTPLPPCRIIDTRSMAAGRLAANTSRDFKVAGANGFELQGGTTGGCAVLEGSTSVLINFVAVSPLGGGNLRGSAYPDPIPTIGSILNYQFVNPNLNIANGVAFPICDPIVNTCDFDIRLFANVSATHVVADVLGFFKRFPTEQIVSGITAGPGLLTSGATGNITLSANFAGTGTANTVARGDHKHYFRTVLVSPIEGGTAAQNGTALLTALNGITTANATNPYLLKIEPGIYDVGGTPVFMQQFVDIEGSGEGVTIIRGIGGASAIDGVLRGVDNSEVRFLSVEANGGGTHCTAMYDGADAPTLTHVTFHASNCSVENIGLYNDLISAPTMFHVTGIATGVGSTISYGIANRDSSPSMHSVTGMCSGGSTCVGIANFGTANPHMVDIVATASGATSFNVGLNNNIGSPVVERLFVRASGGTTAQGIALSNNSTARIQGFSVSANGTVNTHGMFIADSSPTVLNGYVNVSGGSFFNNAINIVGSSQPGFADITTFASAPLGRGFVTSGHTGIVVVERSSISGETSSVVAGSSTTQLRIGASKLWGPVTSSGAGTLTCVASYNGFFVALNTTCN